MKILIAYDGSVFADIAIDDLRKAGLPVEAEALVMCVADGGVARSHEPNEEAWRTKLAEAERLADSAGRRVRSHFPFWRVSSEALLGAAAKVILDTTDWWHPDLLVVGSHGRSGFARLILGSVSVQLLSKAVCSVRVAKGGEALTGSGPLRLVIGNDGSKEAQAVIRSVAARFWPENTEAIILSVVQTLAPLPTALDASTYAQEPAYSIVHEADEETRQRLTKAGTESEAALCRVGLRVTSKVLEGDPREIILCEAEQSKADAIFIGARGMGLVERLLLGSVSNYIVAHAPCTVEIVRARQG